MFRVKLAGLKICIENKYKYIENMCAGYIIDGTKEDFIISVSDEEIEPEQTANYDKGYLESLAIYRKIADKISDYDGLLMHGVLMRYDGKGILLCAKSGVGKSTHAMLWQRLFGSKCEIINGDKPLIRIINNKIFAYGTPWAGKEGIHKNTFVQLSDICFLQRSEQNSAERLTGDVLTPFLSQIYLSKYDGMKILKVMDCIDMLIKNTNQWKICCNMDISAAKTVYDALWG